MYENYLFDGSKCGWQNHRDKDYLIIEYWQLPKLKIWNSADYRILLTAPESQRMEKFVERTIKRFGHFHERRAQIMYDTCEDALKHAANFDFTIVNTYDAQFEKELLRIVDSLVGTAGNA